MRDVMRYERRTERLLPRAQFLRRVAGHVAIGFSMVAVALFIGVAGYHWLAHLRWVDALVNASMILGGMGPVDPLPNDASKIFASLYALFSGLVFIALLAVVLAPFLHRLIHAFHLAQKDDKSE
ncbi:MAG: hypothetical protein ACXVJO_01580 [Thermoanaerobaculia bacterium]